MTIITSPEDANDPEKCDQTLRSAILLLRLLIQKVNSIEGLGAISISHSDHHFQVLGEAYRWLAN